MADKIFAADGNWILHRIFHTATDSLSETIATRFVSLICKDALAVRAKKVIVAFDGNRVFRYRLSDTYKSGRKKDAESVGTIDAEGPYIHLSTVQSYLAELGIPNVQYSDFEADDVLASVAAQNSNVVLGAKDKDILQTLRDDVIMYDSSAKSGGKPAPKSIYTSDAVKILGISQDKCLDLQTLIGDGIDNIPQLVKKSVALKGLNKYGSIKEWMNSDEKFRKFLSKHKNELILNRKLVKLKTDIKVDIPSIRWVKDTKVPTSYIKLKEFCNPKSKGLFGK